MPNPQSPMWWLERLNARLERERPQLELYDRYYWGDHPRAHIPPDLHRKYLVQYEELLRQSKANFMGLVVDTLNNRLKVNGFRLSASEEREPDRESWLTWQANRMDAESRLAIRSALTKGRSALSVWGDGDSSTVMFEDACQCIVENEPGNRRKRAAALKVWADDWTAKDRANVYLPDGIYKFERRKKRTPDSIRSETTPVTILVPGPNQRDEEWVELTEEFVPNTMGVVPIVPIIAHPDDYGCGRSELEGVTAIQERLNGTIFNRVLAGWFAAFRQKWATGISIPEDADGNPVEQWEQAITRMFYDTNPEARFGTFDATDLKQYLEAEEKDVKDIATITATPRHFLIQQGQEPSGDALNAAEAPLLAKGAERQSHLGECFEEAVRLARLFAGQPEGPPDAEIVWADLRDPSVVEAKRTDAIIKQRSEGLISLAMAQEELGYTPQQRQRMDEELMSERLAGIGAQMAADAMTPPNDGTNPAGQ